jgi:hypothetical protein
VEEQANRALQHLLALGVAQGFTLESSQVMPQSRILSLYTSHVSLGDDAVLVWEKQVVDFPAITHPKIAVPGLNSLPQRLKGSSTAVSERPIENPRSKVVYCRPEPFLVLFDPTKVWSSSSSPT